MKWSIFVDVPPDNINDFFESYVKDGAIQIRNEFVKGIVICEPGDDSEEEMDG